MALQGNPGIREYQGVSRVALPYLGVFLAALALRLFGISLQNIWYDEHWTLRVTAVPMSELPELLLAEESSKPPLYFALMHYWMKLGGGEFWLRLPSAIFGSLDCVAAAAVGRQLFGARLGLWLGWLFVFSPFQIHYSQEGRPYALWGLLMTLTFFFLLKFCASPRLRFLFGYVLLGLLACYTFVYSFFVVAFAVVFAALYRPALARKHRSQLVLANGVILLLYVPWLWRVIGSISAGIGFLPVQGRPTYAAACYALLVFAFGISGGPSHEKLRFHGLALFREAPVSGAMLIFATLLAGALIVYGLIVLWRTNRNAFYFSLLGLVCFWGTAALLNLVNPEVPLNPRYAFPALISVALLILASGIAAFRKGGWRWLFPALFFITVCTSLGNHYFNPGYARDDLRSAGHFLRELEPPVDQVVICSGHLADILGYYFIANIPVEPLMIPPSVRADDALQPLCNRLAQVRRFALVYSRPDHGDPQRVLPGYLQSRYRLLDQRHWTGVDVFVFDTAEPVPSVSDSAAP